MLFHPLSPTIPHIAYACLGGFVVMFGMFSLFIREKLYIGEACWAFLFGVIIGPYGAGIFDPRSWANGNEQTTNTITLEFTRVVLAIGVFAIGVELPKAYVARHWKSLFFLLGPVMAWGWFVSAGLIYAFIPGLDFLSSLAVGACLTPTDPILAAAVVGGKYADKHVPAHIRHLLSAECGCNDGAAYPFLFIALYLILESTPGRAIEDWVLFLWLFEIALSVVFGSALGFGFRYLMKFCQRNDLIDRQSYVAQYVSLAFLTIGIMTILGSDDLLASFCCGTAFAWDGFFNRQTEEAVFSSVIDLLFNVASFVYVGAWMPFDSFTNETLTLSVRRLIPAALLILILKRLPVMVALYKFIPDVKTFREALFSGHFGPVGIGAIYISTFAVGYLPEASNPPKNQAEFLASTIQPIVAFIVLCSVAIHGLSIPFFSLGRRVHSVSSRTWSRHATGPDWATLTRHITRGEDVVINRDRDASAMENGRAGLAEEEKTILESRRTSSEGKPPQEDGSEPKMEDTLKSNDTGAKEQTPSYGSEAIMEWKEGSDKVVERRAGPGEEIDVEVVQHAYAHGGSGSAAAGAAHVTAGPLRTAHSYIQHLREGAQKSAGHIKEDPRPDLLPPAEESDGIHKDNVNAGGPNKVTAATDETAEGRPPDDDDDEAWASEDDGEGDDMTVETTSEPSVTRQSSADGRRKRAIQRKRKAVVRPANVAGLHKKGRGRSLGSLEHSSHITTPHVHSPASFSDATLTLTPTPTLTPTYAPTLTPTPVPTPSELAMQDVSVPLPMPVLLPEEGVDRRGRSARQAERYRGSSLSPRSSILHRRLESLRLQQHQQPSRDASPARSIRFADEQQRPGSASGSGSISGSGSVSGSGVGWSAGVSGATTSPSYSGSGTPQNEPWLPGSQVEDSPADEEDPESARGRVTFELPAKR